METTATINSMNMFSMKDLGADLKTARKTIDQALQDFEKCLNAYEVDVEVWTSELERGDWRSISEDEDDPGKELEYTELGYGQVRGQWALLVRARRITDAQDNGDYEYFVEDTEPRRLLSASPSLKAAALTELPKLLVAIKREAQRVISDAQRHAIYTAHA